MDRRVPGLRAFHPATQRQTRKLRVLARKLNRHVPDHLNVGQADALIKAWSSDRRPS